MTKREGGRTRPASPSDVIFGRWPVKEALGQGRVTKLFLLSGMDRRMAREFQDLARSKDVPFSWADKRRLDQMANGNHQGVAAYAAGFGTVEFEDVLAKAKAATTKTARLVFLDGVQDPQNVGSIIRTACFLGVMGVVTPRWRAAPLTAAVARASAGAVSLIDVASVPNLAGAIDRAKEEGLWIVGADMDGRAVGALDVPHPFALVMGSEGEGLHQLVRKKCDFVAAIPAPPGRAGVASLNVGVAAGILLYGLSR